MRSVAHTVAGGAERGFDGFRKCYTVGGEEESGSIHIPRGPRQIGRSRPLAAVNRAPQRPDDVHLCASGLGLQAALAALEQLQAGASPSCDEAEARVGAGPAGEHFPPGGVFPHCD